MIYDAHIHMILDGIYWRDAFARHQTKVNDELIRKQLAEYQKEGFSYLRDGGDRWGVSLRAKELAGEYGIKYRSPAYPICKAGHYGTFIGSGFESLTEYESLVTAAKNQGADFIKIMISGLMDFDNFGVITSEPLTKEEITVMIEVAHQSGLSVMIHANGTETVRYAAQAGADSIEHGAYLEEDALKAMAEHGCIWTPTISTIANLIGDGRYPDSVLEPLTALHSRNIEAAAKCGVPIVIGSDAGAYLVPHVKGAEDERRYIENIVGKDTECLAKGEKLLLKKF